MAPTHIKLALQDRPAIMAGQDRQDLTTLHIV
jgi:hypothetical protein